MLSARFFTGLLALFLLVLTATSDVSAADPVGGEATQTEGDHGHDTGPPLNPEPDLVIWSLVSFVVFLFALKKLAWGPMIEGLTARESGLRQAAADTEHALGKAQALLAEHEKKLAASADEVREIIAEAKRDADRTKQDIITTAQNEAEATKNRAIEDIGHAKDVALKELFDSMSGRVTSATEHVLGRSMNGDDQQRLIEEALSGFSEQQG